MRGDKSALTKGILSPYASRSQIGGESRTFQSINTSPKRQKTSPQTPATVQSETAFHRVQGGCLWGSSGRVREVWRVGRTLRKSPPCASKVFPFPPRLPFRRVVVCAARGTTPCAAYQKFRFCRIAGRRNASAKQVSARAPSNGRANDACRRLRGRRACTCGKAQISFEPPLRHRKPSMCQRTSRLLHRS